MKKKFKKFFVVTIPVSILLFILLEIIVRIFFDHIDYYDNPMDYWSKPAPYSAFTAKPGSYGKKTVNKNGFVSTPEINIEKENNSTRIVFLGGSSTAGMGVNLNDEDTWPWKTVELLKAINTNVKIDFINAALGAYTSFESYGRLWSRIRFFSPDIIVVNHAWNEMYYFNEIADDPLLWRNEEDYDQSLSFFDNLKIKLLSLSQTLVRIKIALNQNYYKQGEVGKNKGLLNSFNPKGVNILKDNFTLLKSYSENFQSKIFFCKQPSLISQNTKEEDKVRCNYELHGFDHNEHVKAFNQIYSLIDEIVEKQYIIDLTTLSGVSENFFDAVHPTKSGTDKIARIVADSLNSNYFIKN